MPAETATAPPPAAPTPAPATPPAAPAAKPSSAPKGLNSLDLYDELRQISKDNKEAAEGKEKNVKKPKDDDGGTVSTKTKSDDSDRSLDDLSNEEKTLSGDLPESEPKDKAGTTPAAPTKAKELREAYESTKKERDLLKSEIEALKRQHGPKEDPERAAITERLTKEEKRRQELEEEIKHLNYERSEEYKKDYQEPLNKAYSRALKEIKEYVVTEDNGNERAATVDDFAAVMRLGPGEVVAKTKAWFGDAAPEVRAMRRQILELDEKATEAVKTYKEKKVEIDERQTAEQAKNRQKAEELWEKHNKEAKEKYPQFFAPKEGDEEGNKLLESGYAMADMHFNPPKDMGLEKRVSLANQVRHRTAGFARVALENKRLTEKLKGLEAELEEFRASEPSKGDGERVASNGGPKTWEEELREVARKR